MKIKPQGFVITGICETVPSITCREDGRVRVHVRTHATGGNQGIDVHMSVTEVAALRDALTAALSLANAPSEGANEGKAPRSLIAEVRDACTHVVDDMIASKPSVVMDRHKVSWWRVMSGPHAGRYSSCPSHGDGLCPQDTHCRPLTGIEDNRGPITVVTP